MPSYFESFPDIQYNGIQCKNITLRAKILEDFKKNASNFYPYTLKDGETADALAFDYYGDPNYCWIIYYANDIIDPYYDWHLSTHEFENFIIKKYGSLAAARSKILYYQKKPSIFYVNNATNAFLPAASYSPAVNGSNWSKVSIDPGVKLAYGTTSYDPALYTAIDAYTEEDSLNEAKRYIRLLDKRLVSNLERQLKEIMNA